MIYNNYDKNKTLEKKEEYNEQNNGIVLEQMKKYY